MTLVPRPDAGGPRNVCIRVDGRAKRHLADRCGATRCEVAKELSRERVGVCCPSSSDPEEALFFAVLHGRQRQNFIGAGKNVISALAQRELRTPPVAGMSAGCEPARLSRSDRYFQPSAAASVGCWSD